jgi:ribonuclease Z
VEAVILTHRHADHVYGLPMLIQGLWLAGREARLSIYGPAETLALSKQLLQLFGLAERDGLFPLDWRPVPLKQEWPLLEIGAIAIHSTPVSHADVHTLALRFKNRDSGKAIVYSADTEPCPGLTQLASDASVLIHEATGNSPGHSSPVEASQIAQDADVKHLVLIHYPVHGIDLEAWRLSATGFLGPVTLAQDGSTYPL